MTRTPRSSPGDAPQSNDASEPPPRAGSGLDPSEAGIACLQRSMSSGALSCGELTRWYLSRIAALDSAGPTLNAVITINPDALAIADALDAERKLGTVRGPLHGIPILVKDNIDTGDRQPTTAGSMALLGAPAAADAEVVRRLRAAGALVLGKTNLTEWANFRGDRSSSGWSAVGGQTRNPYVLDRTPCGSSSGSAVAAAAGLAAAAIGTETNGSIVCPASINGVVGIKPTLGLVSRRGIVPIAHSQDTAGPIARSVEDAVFVLDAIAGSDSGDSATQHADARRVRFSDVLPGASLTGKRLGIVREIGGNDFRGQAVLAAVIRTLTAQGAEVIDPVALPHRTEYSDDEATVLAFEFKAGLASYLATRERAGLKTLEDVIAFNRRHAGRELRWFGQERMERSQAMGGLQDAAYIEALGRSKQLSGPSGIDAALAQHRLDALVALTRSPAWRIDPVNGDNSGAGFGFSGPAAVAGYPHVTVPAGFVGNLPVGVSFVASAWQDAKVIALAHAFETAHRGRRAPQFLPSIPLDERYDSQGLA